MEKLSELGVLFLLFEMGLELSVDRLKVKMLLEVAGHSLQSCTWSNPAAGRLKATDCATHNMLSGPSKPFASMGAPA